MTFPSKESKIVGADLEAAPIFVGSVPLRAVIDRSNPQPIQPPMSSEELSNKTVCVLDTYGILYQVFHTMREMSSPQGEPTGAVFGFVRDLLSLLSNQTFDYLFCAFDRHGPTFRHELDPEYKANRASMPDDLRPQIGFAQEFIDAFGIASVGLVGYEADDLMATIAHVTEENGGRSILVTADKDARQLISDRTSLYILRKQSYYTEENLLADWGIRPDQVIDFQTMVGDSTDNIPGIPLIGPKTATQLLQTWGTLANVFEHVDELTGKKKDNIRAFQDQSRTTEQLVRLKKDVPIELDWEKARFHGVDIDRLKTLCLHFGFRSLLPRLEELGQRFGTIHVEGSAPATDDAPIATPEKPQYHLVDTEEEWSSFLALLKKQNVFSFDLETTDTRPRFAEIVGLSFCFANDSAWYIPVRAPLGSATLNAQNVLTDLRPILESASIHKIGQNIKYDMIVLRNVGITVRGIVFDTMVADYLLHTGAGNHNLDDLSDRYLGHETIKIRELIGSGREQKKMNEVSTELVAEYAGEDAWVVWLLYPILKKKLEEVPTFPKLINDLELPLIDVLVEMESNGIAIDPKHFQALSDEFQLRLDTLEGKIRETVREVDPEESFAFNFNVNSPKQIQRILFDDLHLPSLKKTKTGRSTDIEVLEELAAIHPFPAMLIEHRTLSKLKGTYLDPLPTMRHPQTNRIHTSFNQVVTATGRLSSSDPNLQNIPVRGENGKEIRRGFIPDPILGFDTLVSGDYSQIELRILSHFSEDENLLRAFQEQQDIHTLVASELFDVPPGLVTADMRRKAKAVNFGLIYGQTPYGLAKALGIPKDEAAAYIDTFFKTYPGITDFLQKTLEECREKGYVETMMGRKREIEGVRPWRTGQLLNMPERTAINTIIQGSAADLMKKAMVNVWRRLYLQEKFAPEKAGMLLQIHDELVFETKKEFVADLAQILTEEMELGQPLRVPLRVDIETGSVWGGES